MKRHRGMGCVVFCNTGRQRREILVGTAAREMLALSFIRARRMRGWPHRPTLRAMIVYMQLRSCAFTLQPHRSWARHAAWTRFATERRVH